jgi:hypothetical protein
VQCSRIGENLALFYSRLLRVGLQQTDESKNMNLSPIGTIVIELFKNALKGLCCTKDNKKEVSSINNLMGYMTAFHRVNDEAKSRNREIVNRQSLCLYHNLYIDKFTKRLRQPPMLYHVYSIPFYYLMGQKPMLESQYFLFQAPQ